MNNYRLSAHIGRGRTVYVHVNAATATNARKLARIEFGAPIHYWRILRIEHSRATEESVTLKYS